MTEVAIAPRRPAWVLARAELLVLSRTPLALALSLAFPFAVWLAQLLFIGFSLPTVEFGAMPGVRVIDRLLAELAGTAAAGSGLVVVSLRIASARESGLLGWLRRTPGRDRGFVAAQALAAAALTAASIAAFAVVTFAIYGMPQRWNPLWFAVTVAVVGYCAFAVGLLLGTLTESGARVAGPAIFVVLFLTGGMGVPREGWRVVAPWLYQLTTFNPLAQLNDLVFDAAFLGRLSPTWPAVAGLVAAAITANVVALRRTR
ncbi:MAG: ABC transporter permease [Nonomuraea sp.]|nr:ABC transporter permease [Nonomuraea sp.]